MRRGVGEVLLGGLTFRDVGQHGQRARVGTLSVQDRRPADQRPELGAVAPDEAEVQPVVDPIDPLSSEAFRGDLLSLLVEEGEDGPAHDLLDLIAEHLRQSAVDVGRAAVGVNRPDALAGEFHQRPDPRLALAEHGVRVEAIGDIQHGADVAQGDGARNSR